MDWWPQADLRKEKSTSTLYQKFSTSCDASSAHLAPPPPSRDPRDIADIPPVSLSPVTGNLNQSCAPLVGKHLLQSTSAVVYINR